MELRDIRQVTELLQKYLKRFQLAPSMGEEEVAHWFLPQDNIIDTYVVEVCECSLCHQATDCSLSADSSVGTVFTTHNFFLRVPGAF